MTEHLYAGTTLDSPVGLAGKDLVARMRQEFDYAPVIRTAIREGGVADAQQAEALLEAFRQWFSLLPILEPGSGYVMFKSDVDSVFHAFVLNTKLYREFCYKFLGEFIDHSPIAEDVAETMPLEEYATYTVNFLEKHFGEDLAPALRKWRVQLEEGTWEVSCPHECPDDGAADTRMGRTRNKAIILH